MDRHLLKPVVPVAAIALCAAAMPGTGSAANVAGTCPVTVPKPVTKGSVPFGRTSFNYGNARIRAAIYWPHGTLTAGTLPGGGSMAIINGDGSIYAKVGWWRGVPGNLVVKGRRLDAPAPPLLADIHNESYGNEGFIPSGLTFPTAGCWRVVGKQGGASLTFVVKVTKVRKRP